MRESSSPKIESWWWWAAPLRSVLPWELGESWVRKMGVVEVMVVVVVVVFAASTDGAGEFGDVEVSEEL